MRDERDQELPEKGIVRCIVHVMLSQEHPERDIIIIDTTIGTVALFGYFDAVRQWHYMVVPPEFRNPEVLSALTDYLQQAQRATLRCIEGDTINLSTHQMQTLPPLSSADIA